MAQARASKSAATYDPRWFIWTIVFLIVTGMSLVSYITVTGYNEETAAMDASTSHAVVNR